MKLFFFSFTGLVGAALRDGETDGVGVGLGYLLELGVGFGVLLGVVVTLCEMLGVEVTLIEILGVLVGVHVAQLVYVGKGV